ncbi:uncharacterized protein C8orf48 homolog isoform X1 [Rhinatrema bivittatum]|uniref:uncharacterized protein C8orf48 homolog isoform X1 n=1 Tax=Rhinatrema bivittatum TaxID=194408 RepID=UPI00112C7737|nr:uncharacterized protein C8orf48 homolog isoform X1 [Rhinatrema bivittatum]XP_029463567.1 uncharacterized protein C8orf48 homolog isoform X1 [Rhinatrema bivittatum]XP_029463568.1 uncharacterized protein C8orf48 homolog isoform X1 [Rhinatrema bivittatum]XP_029463569.1 uncharacterized protein C8orf48 homolog isoform X1 [Rhinatrema bivittatum]
MSDELGLARSREEELVKAGQSPSSNISEHSQEALRSLTEENGCSWGYENESFESCSYDGESELSSVSEALNSKDNGILSATLQVYKDEKPEVPDSELVQRALLCKWIGILQDKEHGVRHQRVAKRPQTGATEAAGDALRTFCSLKINQIHHLLNSQQRNGSRQKRRQLGVHPKKPMASDRTCAGPGQLMNRVQLKNIQETMKKVADIKMHQPSKCPDCCRKKGELAKIEFLRRRKTAMQTILLREKIEEEIFVRDSLTLIGEIHQTLPRLSEDPKIIWQRLFKAGCKA